MKTCPGTADGSASIGLKFPKDGVMGTDPKIENGWIRVQRNHLMGEWLREKAFLQEIIHLPSAIPIRIEDAVSMVSVTINTNACQTIILTEVFGGGIPEDWFVTPFNSVLPNGSQAEFQEKTLVFFIPFEAK